MIKEPLSIGEPVAKEDPHSKETEKLHRDLALMTNELDRSRALMDLKFPELQSREETLQRTIQDSVQKALEEYIANNPSNNAPAQLLLRFLRSLLSLRFLCWISFLFTTRIQQFK